MLKQRYRRILWFFGGVLLNILWWDIFLAHLGLRRLAKHTRPARLRKAARRFRALAVQMGGVMIKVGQFLSARVDVLPHEVTDELADLQDEVAPEPFEHIRQVIEQEFRCPLEEKFSHFEITPLAAASIGQVHRACLREETEPAAVSSVVVKVQRPDIEQLIEVDLSALRVVARWVMLYPPISKRADIPALLEEVSHSVHEEIDYIQEGNHAATFAENFRTDAHVLVPSVYWSHTTRRVLALEDVLGIKITDYDAIEAAGISRAEVAERLFNVYLKQIFDDRFFHADPHPGNLFVLPTTAGGETQNIAWKLVFVDFGMVGRLDANVLAGLREMLVGVGLQDPSRVVKSYQMLGVLLPGADLEMIARAEERAFKRFWGKTAPELIQMRMNREEITAFLQDFGELLYEMPFQVPQNMILLGRCLAILSGICTGLNPDFNVFTLLEPYSRKLVSAEGNQSLNFWFKEITQTLTTLISLPRKADALIQRIEQGKLETQNRMLLSEVKHLERTQRRMVGAILCGSFLISATLLYMMGAVPLAGAASLIAMLLLVWSLLFR